MVCYIPSLLDYFIYTRIQLCNFSHIKYQNMFMKFSPLYKCISRKRNLEIERTRVTRQCFFNPNFDLNLKCKNRTISLLLVLKSIDYSAFSTQKSGHSGKNIMDSNGKQKLLKNFSKKCLTGPIGSIFHDSRIYPYKGMNL